MSRLLSLSLLLVVWLALWGEITVVNVVSGLAVVVIVAVLLRRSPGAYEVNPLGVIRLLAVFTWRLLTSSAVVVLTVLLPTPERRRSGVVGIELSEPSPLVAAIVADAISLTPGTLTLDVRYPTGTPDGTAAPTLFVHVLGLADPEEIREDVRGLERLVLAAVTPAHVDDDPMIAEATDLAATAALLDDEGNDR